MDEQSCEEALLALVPGIMKVISNNECWLYVDFMEQKNIANARKHHGDVFVMYIILCLAWLFIITGGNWILTIRNPIAPAVDSDLKNSLNTKRLRIS
ncbi:hypothetical protein M6D81_24935 [Paenibacillus sp. J5C_2022]|uniref:hypothetical protein n=1 Tax=Paenibacillus sp. J5C2022 TaxID=2977129 RepID=UPI0021D10A14|nr:hypothetical protein [Paenibacillus sp. J5C2022]MCU6711953.1 hypothetical protein [Paenibacillus sp. J5C2022]